VGEKVALSTISKEKFEGEMIGVENDEIILMTKENGEQKIPFRSISKAKTYFEW
jgi:ribosome maturation factor RimP